MPWNTQLDQFDSPNFDTIPYGYLCQKAIDIFLLEQTRVFTWWNNKWSTKVGCLLNPLEEKQCFIGFPLDTNTRGLYVFPSIVRDKKDNFRQDKTALGIVYQTGKTQALASKAYKYNDVNEASLYLEAIYSLYDTMPYDKLVGVWESTGYSEQPEIRQFTQTILNPDQQFPSLVALGVQAYINIELVVYPGIIYNT